MTSQRYFETRERETMYMYNPEYCDYQPCCKNCDVCSIADKQIEDEKEGKENE
jgi:hypothetical protein